MNLNINKNVIKKNIFDYEWNKEKDINFDFFNRNRPSISSENFPQSYFQIIGLFAEDCNYHLTKCYVDHYRLFINGGYRGNYNELMLRYGRAEKELIVARVQFIHRRKGKMNELYRILKLIQKRYKTGNIIIESVVSDEMRMWCEKNKLIKDPNTTNYIQDK